MLARATVGIGLCWCVLAAVGCRSDSQADASDPGARTAADSTAPTVVAVSYPLAYFATRIAGDHVNVEIPAPAGVVPANWEPDGEAIAGIRRAERVLLNGAVDAGWIDPDLAILQAESVAAVLSDLLPDQRELFLANQRALAAELSALSVQIESIITQAPDTPVIFSRPDYQYLTRRFGLNARSVNWEPDEMPSAEAWSELEQLLIFHRAEWMIWEREPSQATVERLHTVGIESVVFDPCDNRPEDGDFMSVMRQNADNLRRVYQ